MSSEHPKHGQLYAEHHVVYRPIRHDDLDDPEADLTDWVRWECVDCGHTAQGPKSHVGSKFLYGGGCMDGVEWGDPPGRVAGPWKDETEDESE